MKKIMPIFLLGLLLGGCASRNSAVTIIKKAPPIVEEQNLTQLDTPNKVPPPPRKKIKLKKVEDTNYNDNYMYPVNSSKKNQTEKVVNKTNNNASSMSKEECISMISQEKYDKYSKMFGSEEASIKRCKMLKAMKK